MRLINRKSLILVFFSVIIPIHVLNAKSEDATSTTSKTMVLNKPFYVENYKDTVVKPEPQNKSSTKTFTAKGIINGNLNVNTEINATKTWINNDTAYL